MKTTKAIYKIICDGIDNLDKLKQEIEAIRDEQQESFDARSENWQEGERGAEAQEEIDELDSIVNDLEQVRDQINDMFEG